MYYNLPRNWESTGARRKQGETRLRCAVQKFIFTNAIKYAANVSRCNLTIFKLRATHLKDIIHLSESAPSAYSSAWSVNLQFLLFGKPTSLPYVQLHRLPYVQRALVQNRPGLFTVWSGQLLLADEMKQRYPRETV